MALKTSVEHTSKMGMSQFNKTSDRLDKVEKAQAEPAAKLAKLSEAVDKLAPLRRRLPQPPVAAQGRHGIGHPLGDAAAAPAGDRQGPRSAGCRRSMTGSCATSPMAAR